MEKYRPGSVITVLENTYPGYEELEAILNEALDQAAAGKGKERHGQGDKPFTQQMILEGQRKFGIGFALGQANKKIEEAFNMPEWERSKRDLLGAIVYVAAAIIYGDEKNNV